MEIKKSSSLVNLSIILSVFFLTLLLTLPVLANIPAHPDEYQFYANAFSIMQGKELQNYLHVAFTEYLLAGFLAVTGLFTRSGVNFPQGNPSLVTIFYGRVFGFLLYFLTFLLGCILVQKGEKEVKFRTVLFAVLYFGSLGIFERFLRVNSDSVMLFLFLNYLLVSLFLHRRRAALYHFFLINLTFIFLLSFTNLKSLYLAWPILLINTAAPFFWYPDLIHNRQRLISFSWVITSAIFLADLIYVAFLSFTNLRLLPSALPVFILNSLNPFLWLRSEDAYRDRVLLKVYKLTIYLLGLLAGAVFLWFIFMPRPFDAHRFWYQIKNTIVFGTEFDFDYPGQSYGSWAVYIYDLFIEYIGISQILSVFITLILARILVGAGLIRSSTGLVKELVKSSFNWAAVKSGDLYRMTELLLTISFISYYLGVSARVVHWSRWGVPLGFISLIFLSLFLEKILLMVDRKKVGPKFILTAAAVLFLVAWFPRILLAVDLNDNGYPRMNGHKETVEDIDRFIKEAGIPSREAAQKVSWFTGYTQNVGNLSLEDLVDPADRGIEYLLWPQWNIGLLYTPKNVDKSTHNQRVLVEKYGESIAYRFPSFLSRYTHFAKYFGWSVLGLTYSPELESLIEPQYAVIKLKKISPPLKFNYTLGFNDLSHYFLPKSPIFNINNLPESYLFPPCYSNPAVAYVSTGKEVAPDPETGSRTMGLFCHSLRFRVAFKGIYAIKIEGLPADLDNSQMVYSAYGYNYDPVNRIITFLAPQTFITVEFGVATKEKYLPSLKYHVYYQSLPPETGAKK